MNPQNTRNDSQSPLRHFDKTFYLNLKKRKDRKAHIEAELSKVNIKAERFQSINGQRLRNIKEDPERRYTRGAEALVRTVVRLIRKAKKEKISSVCIIEDDAVLLPSFQNEIPFLENKPDNWRLLYLATKHVQKPEFLTAIDIPERTQLKTTTEKRNALRLEYQQKKKEFEAAEEKASLVKVLRKLELDMKSLHAECMDLKAKVKPQLIQKQKEQFGFVQAKENYSMTIWAIHERAYDHFLELASKGGQVLEEITNEMNRDGNAYALRTTVAKQLNGFSDIAQQEINTDFLLTPR